MWQTQSQDSGLSIEVQHKGSTTDELKAKLEARLVKRDMVPMEDCPSIEEEEIPVPDFLQDNK
jgi:hypothetical protein